MIVETDLPVVACTVFGVVLTGAPYRTLTPQEQESIIAHEYGHIHHRHTQRRLWWILTLQWDRIAERCRAQEFEADRYATMGGFGHGLLKFLSRMHNAQHSDFHPSPVERMENIKRWIGYEHVSSPS